MGIEINGLNNRATQGAGTSKQDKEVQGGKGESADKGAPTTQGDSVSLTDTASRLSNLSEALADTPVVNTDKVAAFREAIANGSYQVNPEKVAEKLMGLEESLG
ncbi:flagellar biosynthesis anti-sigma factor FlgM [Solemya pervernicosa gill symbiont]|uniref:Negative regulator of flagellin synthesis n=2 Tax=Gammaproteobacteria incertae sedis TaxID=118884 RepID=A0A1T2L8T0_9GAMM|nr:flagellar biosynthesis anti-sigma factor FlgM [Candidatus Reidiella endopervernicosa]OOZ41491.1 flagellar biosynthesis anti-sigma factor FlgM [Solemya pervernicosa gill symbiont]QKQ27310.1 flagellar biosynthesis anti-sigma factor FlgM [Candidatus Reidiella endopervernicosa]